MPLLSGDRLQDGRTAASKCSSPTAARCTSTARSTIDVQSDDLVRLIDGRLRLNIAGSARSAVAYRIDSPAGSVAHHAAGRVPDRAPRVRPGTDGAARSRGDARRGGNLHRSRGRRRCAPASARTRAPGWRRRTRMPTTRRNWDAFDRWSESRRDMRLGVSSQYLPSDMQPYASHARRVRRLALRADLRPRLVSARRRRTGVRITTAAGRRIRATAGRGSARIGLPWPTHHYGRWGFSAGVWFWIPSARWAPALRVVGVCARLRELVSARLEQPRGHRLRSVPRGSGLLLVSTRVDRGRLLAFRPRLRPSARG